MQSAEQAPGFGGDDQEGDAAGDESDTTVTDAGGARTVTLPNAATYGVGKVLTIADHC